MRATRRRPSCRSAGRRGRRARARPPGRPKGMCRSVRSGRTSAPSRASRSRSAIPVSQLEAEPPVVRVLAAEAGQHSVEARELHCRRLGERLGSDSLRRLELPGEHGEIGDRPADARAGRSFETHPGACPDVREVGRKRHLGALGDERRGYVEAVVRVDAPTARLGDRRAGIEGQP